MSKKHSLKQNLNVALVQTNSSTDTKQNLQSIDQQLSSLKSKPVDVIILPEMFNSRAQKNKKPDAEPLNGPTLQWLKDCARTHEATMVGGSITERGPGNKNYNTMIVVNPSGEIVDTYRKIHLFDVNVNNTSIHESRQYHSGNQPKVITINGWRFGLSICYDIRFPELYRTYFKQRVDAILIPASFTKATGEKHWKILCQARAIENQAFVLAPNQCGLGAGGVDTYGTSLAVDPDGHIINQGNETQPEVMLVELKYSILENVRQQMPNHDHACLLRNSRV